MMSSICAGHVSFAAIVVALIVGIGTHICADEAKVPQSDSQGAESRPTLTIDEARRHAKLLHTTIHSTLRVVHDRYYREDEALPIPAAAMGEIFRDIESMEHVRLRWLAVDGQAMNTDHVAQGEFETEAVKALKAGKLFHEQVTEHTYLRAAPITLSNHCLKCHMPDRKSTKDRTAGLIIAIPIGQ
ncbi:MAG: DUF3365 domain-containing protein [Planctomyces sp.]|nr:DUF3365 domain-containing protein [Planctomyces sp.]